MEIPEEPPTLLVHVYLHVGIIVRLLIFLPLYYLSKVLEMFWTLSMCNNEIMRAGPINNRRVRVGMYEGIMYIP